MPLQRSAQVRDEILHSAMTIHFELKNHTVIRVGDKHLKWWPVPSALGCFNDLCNFGSQKVQELLEIGRG
jgi:hypothetical protein